MADILEIIPRARTAILPFAPQRAEYPAFSGDPRIREIHDGIARLHWLAFVALYGPPPKCVDVQAIYTGRAGDLLEPRYMAIASRDASPAAYAWLDAFTAGLDHWGEVEMAAPCAFTPADDRDPPQRLQVHYRSEESVLTGALWRLARKRRHRELRNLRAELGDCFPKRFDPDAAEFIGSS